MESKNILKLKPKMSITISFSSDRYNPELLRNFLTLEKLRIKYSTLSIIHSRSVLVEKTNHVLCLDIENDQLRTRMYRMIDGKKREFLMVGDIIREE